MYGSFIQKYKIKEMWKKYIDGHENTIKAISGHKRQNINKSTQTKYIK